jgi:hypothetical protein
MIYNLKIYRSILTGSFQPWLEINKSESIFKKIMSNEQARVDDLDSYQIKTWDFEIIFEKVNDYYGFYSNKEYIYITNENKMIFSRLYEVEYPKGYNYKTNFYNYIIYFERFQLIKKIEENIQSGKHNPELYLGKILDEIKYKLHETSQQIRTISYSNQIYDNTETLDTEISLKKECDFILRSLQNSLVMLILEIQTLFSSQSSKEPFSEEDIYRRIIKSESPKMIQANEKIIRLTETIQTYIKNKEATIIDFKSFLNEANHLYLYLNQVLPHNPNVIHKIDELVRLVQVCENVIFIKKNAQSGILPAESEYLSEFITVQFYNEYTAKVSELLANIDTLAKKLELLSLESDKISFLKSTQNIQESYNDVSIPRKVLNWLEIQKKSISENHTNDLSKIKSNELPKILTSLTVDQIGYLLRTLEEEGILVPKDKVDLSRVFSAILSSKKREVLSPGALHNEFKTPHQKAVQFWEDKFFALKQKAYKDKEKFLD